MTDAAMSVVEDLRKDGGVGGVLVLDEKRARECFSLEFQLF